MKKTVQLTEAYGMIDGLRSLQCTSFKMIDAKYKNLKALETAITNQIAINKEINENGGEVPGLEEQTLDVELVQVDQCVVDSLGDFKCNENGYLTISQHMIIDPKVEDKK